MSLSDFLPISTVDDDERGGRDRTANQHPPWFRPEHIVTGDGLLTLHNEILDLCDLLQPHKEEKQQTEIVLDFMRRVCVEALGTHVEVLVFGSQLTGLVLPTSDIDFIVNKSQENAIFELGRAMRRRQNCGDISGLEIIAKARVPILKFIHSATKRPCDVCFNLTSGLQTGTLTRSMLDQMPQVRPLVMVLKYFLGQRKLNETYHGGVGSYLLLLLVRSFVQYWKRQESLNARGEEFNLGVLLMSFLEMYGKKFNTAEVGISLRGGGAYFSKRKRGWLDGMRKDLLSVENPEDPNIDVGRNSYQVAQTLQAFEHSHDILMSGICTAEGWHGPPQSILAHAINSDAVLVGRALPRDSTFMTKEYRHREKEGDPTAANRSTGVRKKGPPHRFDAGTKRDRTSFGKSPRSSKKSRQA